MTSTRENGFESPAQLSFDVFAVEEVTEEHLISNQDLNESTSDVSEMFCCGEDDVIVPCG